MNKLVRKTLEKHMQLLSERAATEDLNGVTAITEQLVMLATILDPELRTTFKTTPELPCIGYAFNWLKTQNADQNPEATDAPESHDD